MSWPREERGAYKKARSVVYLNITNGRGKGKAGRKHEKHI
jgi:hypothetical protein